MGGGERGKDEGKSNYSFLGGWQLLHSASVPPLSLLITFIAIYRKIWPLCFSLGKQIRFKHGRLMHTLNNTQLQNEHACYPSVNCIWTNREKTKEQNNWWQCSFFLFIPAQHCSLCGTNIMSEKIFGFGFLPSSRLPMSSLYEIITLSQSKNST